MANLDYQLQALLVLVLDLRLVEDENDDEDDS